MLGGAYYIWFMLIVFAAVIGMILLLGLLLWIGHWINRSETGEKHGFLELPENLRPQSPPPESPPDTPTENPPTAEQK